MQRKFLVEAKVPGNPVGKGRPRVTMRGAGEDAHARAYTPAKTAAWEKAASTLYRLTANPPRVRVVIDALKEGDTRYSLEVYAVASRPASLSRKKDLEGFLLRTTKPDGDNVIKCVADAIVKGGLLTDDKQIVHWVGFSLYAPKGEDGFVLARIYQIEDEPFVWGIPAVEEVTR